MKGKFLLSSIMLIILLTAAGTINAQTDSGTPPPVYGSGTLNYIPLFTGTSTIGNSIIFQKQIGDGLIVPLDYYIGIGTANPDTKLHVTGSIGNNWITKMVNNNANGKGLLVVGGSLANNNTVFELQNAETSNNSLLSVLSGRTVNIGSGMSKITFGDAGCVAPLWDCRYMGFNAEKINGTSGWTTYTNGADNGGSIIYTTVGGDINFVSIPTYQPSSNQTFSDNLIAQKRTFTIYNDATGNSKTRTSSYDNAAQMWVVNNQDSYGMGVDADGKGYIYEHYDSPTPLMTFYNSNIGIGTTTPDDQLHIKKDIQNLSGTVGIRISSSQFPWFIGLNHSLSDANLTFANGNDKNNPNMVLTSDGGTKFSSGISKLGIGSANNPTLYGTSYVGFNAYRDGSISSWIIDGNNSAHNGGSLIYGTKNGDMSFVTVPSTSGSAQTLTDQNILDHLAMTIKQNGNVGIGTPAPGDYKLAVAGKIHCTEVVVEATPWPDYVFDKGYKLMPVKELEQYVNINKHLPGIPDAQTVSEKGVSVGEMNAQLLKKVEELTQYIILLNQRIEKLESQNTNH